MIRVNRCGKTEDKFVNGWCKECASTCEMNEEQMIDKRVYDYAMRHGLLSCGMFSISNFKTYFENHPCICFLQALFGQSCKTKMDIVASPKMFCNFG